MHGTAAEHKGGNGWHSLAKLPALQLSLFAATIFLSALLLFSVQPMFARMVLPKLGGTPAVWAVSMCFFQVVLLAGYCAAHLLNARLAPMRAAGAHVALLLLACAALPVGLPTGFAEPPDGDAYLWLIGLLAAGIGLPFLALSANAPLLQAWFSRTGHAHARDPYFLYGASNLGSLLALVAYPIVIEPRLGLAAQSRLWSFGFVALGVMIALSAALMLACRGDTLDGAESSTPAATPAPSSATRATWVALAFVPSGLMVAVTTHLTTDIGSAPFLWVLPLALLLATFILVFRTRPPLGYRFVPVVLLVSALVVVLASARIVNFAAALAGFFCAALLCHRQLYERRPNAEHLTEFYIWMSVGGALGGMFSALVAPHLFTTVFEFKLLLLAALLFRSGILLDRAEPVRIGRVLLVLATGAALMLAYKSAVAGLADSGWLLYVLIAVLLLGLFSIRKWPEHNLALVLVAIAAASLQPSDTMTVHAERTFYGTHRVVETARGEVRILMHGTTTHGAQRIKDRHGNPAREPMPATYYRADGPMAKGFELARRVAAGRRLRTAVVGLGTGSLACFLAADEAMTYYEIDPSVARIARDQRYFSFISHCRPNLDIVLGDARLTLSRAPAKSLDYLIVDAFSSDAIPIHLLTREALALYLDRMDDDGIIALHVSNRYLDLAPAVSATLAQFGGTAAVYVRYQPADDAVEASPSDVIFLAKRAAVLSPALQWQGAEPLAASSVEPWTDDFADVLGALLRRLRGDE